MSLKDKLKENHIQNKTFDEFETDVAHYNLSTLRQISLVGMCTGMILVLVSLPPLRLLTLIQGYFSITVLFAIVYLLTGTVLQKHSKAILPVYYGFIVLILLLAILMGTYLGRETNATTFVMLVMVLPMFIIDKPVRLHLLFGVMSAAFCVTDAYFKSGSLLSLDIANCIVFYLLSIAVSRQSIRAKMSDIIIKRELKQQSDMDILTKLNNRGAFERVVAQYIHESNKNAVMLIMDIDNFKAVNDSMGHAYGDMVLQLVGEYLQAAFRSGDIVSRLGGDEFVAFLPAVTDLGAITAKVQQLIDRVKAIKVPPEASCIISVSIGLAEYPEDGCTFEELYKRADSALYLAKNSGKGRYAFYEPTD